jgi:hypothetical protein
MDSLNQYPYAKLFLDRLAGYLSGRERDLEKCIEAIRLIEYFLEHEKDCLADLILENVDQAAADKFERDYILWHITASLRRKIASDKLMYYRFGLLQTKAHGDLRTARWVRGDRERLFAALKFKATREHPNTVAYLKQETQKLEPDFLGRVGRILLQSPLESKHVSASPLQQFLLRYWMGSHSDKNGHPIPALCDCTDLVIAKLAAAFGVKGDPTPDLVKKTWQRLGLCKAAKIIFKTVSISGKTITFDEFRPRR